MYKKCDSKMIGLENNYAYYFYVKKRYKFFNIHIRFIYLYIKFHKKI